MAWWRRIFRFLFRKGMVEKGEDGELPRHVDLWMRELIDEGMEPQAAREEALRCFSDVGVNRGAGGTHPRPGAVKRACDQ